LLEAVGKAIILLHDKLVLLAHKTIIGPPRILKYSPELNVELLRAFGATIGEKGVVIAAPVTMHPCRKGFGNLTIRDGRFLGGNNYLDLNGCITLEEAAGLAAGVMIISHNNYINPVLEERMNRSIGVKDVLTKKGASIKAGAIILMGVTVGEYSVVGAGSVVNSDVPDNCLAAGAPARVIREIK